MPEAFILHYRSHDIKLIWPRLCIRRSYDPLFLNRYDKAHFMIIIMRRCLMRKNFRELETTREYFYVTWGDEKLLSKSPGFMTFLLILFERNRFFVSVSEPGIPTKLIRFCRIKLSITSSSTMVGHNQSFNAMQDFKQRLLCDLYKIRSSTKIGKSDYETFNAVWGFRQGLSCDLFNFVRRKTEILLTVIKVCKTNQLLMLKTSTSFDLLSGILLVYVVGNKRHAAYRFQDYGRVLCSRNHKGMYMPWLCGY